MYELGFYEANWFNYNKIKIFPLKIIEFEEVYALDKDCDGKVDISKNIWSKFFIMFIKHHQISNGLSDFLKNRKI